MEENQQTTNPYGAPQEPQYGTTGKKIGMGFGIASMVLGILSLLCFCTCINVVFSILAIIFGVIQIVNYEGKSFAIAGIATAIISFFLFMACYIMLFANTTFTHMMEKELNNGYTEKEIIEFIEEYQQDVQEML